MDSTYSRLLISWQQRELRVANSRFPLRQHEAIRCLIVSVVLFATHERL